MEDIPAMMSGVSSSGLRPDKRRRSGPSTEIATSVEPREKATGNIAIRHKRSMKDPVSAEIAEEPKDVPTQIKNMVNIPKDSVAKKVAIDARSYEADKDTKGYSHAPANLTPPQINAVDGVHIALGSGGVVSHTFNTRNAGRQDPRASVSASTGNINGLPIHQNFQPRPPNPTIDAKKAEFEVAQQHLVAAAQRLQAADPSTYSSALSEFSAAVEDRKFHFQRLESALIDANVGKEEMDRYLGVESDEGMGPNEEEKKFIGGGPRVSEADRKAFSEMIRKRKGGTLSGQPPRKTAEEKQTDVPMGAPGNSGPMGEIKGSEPADAALTQELPPSPKAKKGQKDTEMKIEKEGKIEGKRRDSDASMTDPGAMSSTTGRPPKLSAAERRANQRQVAARVEAVRANQATSELEARRLLGGKPYSMSYYQSARNLTGRTAYDGPGLTVVGKSRFLRRDFAFGDLDISNFTARGLRRKRKVQTSLGTFVLI